MVLEILNNGHARHFVANEAAIEAERAYQQLNDQLWGEDIGYAILPRRVLRTSEQVRLEQACDEAHRVSQLASVSRASVCRHCELGDIRSAINILERTVAADLLREIFGNPFRSAAFDDEWGSDTALSLAKHIYEARDFSTMPILSDALQDAGCDNADILNHCRQPGEHVRGCWVVDLLTGRK
jgi:hypothetical protein